MNDRDVARVLDFWFGELDELGRADEAHSERWYKKDPAFDERLRAEFADLLQEDRTFVPPEAFRRQARIQEDHIYVDADRDPEAFWARFADELEWFRRWDKVLDWQPPHARWFVGGQLNVAVNCLDRHVRGPRRNKAAILWEGEPGDRRTLTYFELFRDVSAFATRPVE